MESPEQEDHLLYISGGDDEEQEVKLEDDFAVEKSKASAAINKNYTILTEEDIFKRQGDAVASVCSVLSLSKTAAFLLLHRYNWNANVVYDEWFASEESVRKAVGLLPENTNPLIGISRSSSSSSSIDELACRICFENFPPESFYSAACGHRFCESCWKSYIRTAINDGAGCLTLRCPETSCAAVGLDMIRLLASREDQEKYNRFLLRSFVEQNRNRKWCPSPGCALAVEYHPGGGDDDGDGGSYDVTCNCSHVFCWNCTEERHRPVDCETLENWKSKYDAESNLQWIMTNTKPCPKCKRPIEKNLGCNHMTCSPPCGFQFCWLCLIDWSTHTSCNRYKSTTKEKSREHLRKYIHYYKRFASNDKSKRKALSDLRDFEKHIAKSSESQSQRKLKLDFVVDAWKQIVECRRILKWSYVYGYYLSEEEGGFTKLQLFEYLQGQAESGLERLHHCAEQERERGLKQYINGRCNCEKFVDYRSKLKHLTRVTGNYFENLVGALKNGLSEVDSNGDHHIKKRLRRR